MSRFVTDIALDAIRSCTDAGKTGLVLVPHTEFFSNLFVLTAGTPVTGVADKLEATARELNDAVNVVLAERPNLVVGSIGDGVWQIGSLETGAQAGSDYNSAAEAIEAARSMTQLPFDEPTTVAVPKQQIDARNPPPLGTAGFLLPGSYAPAGPHFHSLASQTVARQGNEMQTTIAQRSGRLLSLADFAGAGSPEPLGPLDLTPPPERQYILRMVLRAEHSALLVPAELAWLQPLIDLALAHQAAIGADHPFVYATVRHGVVNTVSDDEWHTDGFSMKVPHVPEQNYVWSSQTGTEYVPTDVTFPADFDPLRHNVHRYLGGLVDESTVQTCEARSVYCMDPYLLHRRPAGTAGVQRTFVRLSFVPIEIDDINQTQNPLLPRSYAQDGVAFRNRLAIYPAA